MRDLLLAVTSLRYTCGMEPESFQIEERMSHGGSSQDESSQAIRSGTATLRPPLYGRSADGDGAEETKGDFGISSLSRKHRLAAPMLVASDLLLGGGVLATALPLRSMMGLDSLSNASIFVALAAVAVWIGLRAQLGLYPGYGLSRDEELRLQTRATFLTLAIVAIGAVVLQAGDTLSRMLMILTLAGLLVVAPPFRYAVKRWLMHAGAWGKPVAVMGCGTIGAQLVSLLRKEWELGYRPIGVFDDRNVPVGNTLEDVPYGGTLADATYLAQHQSVDTVVFAMPYTRRQNLARHVNLARLNFRHVVVIPNLAGITNSAVVSRDFAGIFGVEIRYNLLDPRALRAKRLLDVVATALGGMLILPLVLILYVLVRFESSGPVFYKAQRMGQNGRLFSCIKFRTMAPEAEELLRQLLAKNEEAKREYTTYHKLRNDPRVTRVGRFLRKTSLDELPQLWNVLRGEMSLVGPRPYLPRESEDIGITQNEILRVPPGLTGPWQVSGRHETPFSERVQMDAHYVQNWSVWLDIILLARTVRVLLFDRAA